MSTNEPIIRLAQSKDAQKLTEFNLAMAMETENLALSQDVVLKGVRHLMQHPQHGFYTVAEINSELQGALLITKEWSDWRNGMYWWIQSVYVTESYRRMGVYRGLYNHIRKLADSEGDACGFRLYVEQNNRIAQNTYRSLGMMKTDYLVFEELIK